MKQLIAILYLVFNFGMAEAAIKHLSIEVAAGTGIVRVRVNENSGAVWVDWNSTGLGVLSWTLSKNVFVDEKRCTNSSELTKNAQFDYSPMPKVEYKFQIVQFGISDRQFLDVVGSALGWDKLVWPKLFVVNPLENVSGTLHLEWSDGSFVTAAGPKAIEKVQSEISSSFAQQEPGIGQKSSVLVSSDNYLLFCDIALGKLAISYSMTAKTADALTNQSVLPAGDITKVSKAIQAVGKPQPKRKYTWSDRQDEASVLAGVLLGYQLAKQLPQLKLDSLYVEDTLTLYEGIFSETDFSARPLNFNDAIALSRKIKPSSREFDTVEIKINEFKKRDPK